MIISLFHAECPVNSGITESIQKSVIGVYELICLLAVFKDYQAEYGFMDLSFQSSVPNKYHLRTCTYVPALSIYNRLSYCSS